jgi:hypothetical protein
MTFQEEFFEKFTFTKDQIDKYFATAKKSLEIAENASVPDVTFNFSYNALIKIGIAEIASKGFRIRSHEGHHMKIIQSLSEILKDENINAFGNLMRRQRNLDLYNGGIFIAEKQSKEYLQFVKEIFKKATLQ